jgi:protein-S-isoprenylcysteine O-methyltransferase Ste14
MTADIPYRIALVALAVVQLTVSSRFMKKAEAGGTILQKRAEGLPLSIAIAGFYIVYCLAVLVYLINPQWMAWSAMALPVVVRWSGAVIMAMGAAFHIWGMIHLGTNLTISISTRDEHTLITTGPYRWVRHPLYAGGMLESIGVCLVLANVSVVIAAGCFWGLIAYRTGMEEERLSETFGEPYREYRERVGRFVPVRLPRGE